MQAVLTGSQEVRAGGSGGEADVQRRGADLQHQQLTGGTDREEIFSISQTEPLLHPAGPITSHANVQLRFVQTPRIFILAED